MARSTRTTAVLLAALLAPAVCASHLAAQSCTPVPLSCGQTISASLSSSSCLDPKSGYYNGYSLDGLDGEEVTATLSSTTPNVVVLAALGNGPIVSFDDRGAVELAGLMATEAGTSQLTYTLDQTSDSWFITVAAADPSLRSFGVAASYSLSLACSGLTSCRAGAETLCLDTGRFQVEAAYADSTGQSGPAQMAALSDQTGYLWFFGPTNVEAVVKVLDGCSVNSRYWVFAGGLTNVKVVLTVTDTKTNTVKKYTNPENATFEPIQDTSAFATCP
jgi:hypothetical protein